MNIQFKSIRNKSKIKKIVSLFISCAFFICILPFYCFSSTSKASPFTYADVFIHENLEEEILQSKFNYQLVYSFADRLNEHAIPYNESQSASIYEHSKRIDNAIIQLILRYRIPITNTIIEDSFVRSHNNSIFLFQKIRIHLPNSMKASAFNSALKENLTLWAEYAHLEYDAKKEKSYIYVDDELTHEISYNKPKSNAKLSIVIDDLGSHISDNFDLLSLEFPVSFSILPDTAHASLTSELAHFANREVFLHQPMLALNGRFIEDTTLMLYDSKEIIKKKLSSNFANVPYARALNNHTGSSFTQNKEAVKNFLEVQKEIDPTMRILDSRTISNSRLYGQSKAMGFNTKNREIFLDNVQDVQEITKQLDKALKMALRTNIHIVVIGHPHETTRQALKEWKGHRNTNIQIVRVFEPHPLVQEGLLIYPYVQNHPAPFVSAPSYQP